MIKNAEYYVMDNKIEVYNSILGKERVILNGKKVSEVKNKKDCSHKFHIGNCQYQIASQGKSNLFSPQKIEVKKDGTPVFLDNFISYDSRKILCFIIITGLGFGFIISRLTYDLLFSVLGL